MHGRSAGIPSLVAGLAVLAPTQDASGVLLSRGDNTVEGNGTDTVGIIGSFGPRQLRSAEQALHRGPTTTHCDAGMASSAVGPQEVASGAGGHVVTVPAAFPVGSMSQITIFPLLSRSPVASGGSHHTRSGVDATRSPGV